MEGKQFYPSSLKPLKKQYELKNIATVDIETNKWADFKDTKEMSLEEVKDKWDTNPILPFLICFYDTVTKTEKAFDGKNCMRDFLTYYLQKKYRNRITYAHYGGKFDFIPIYETLAKHERFHKYTPKIVYVNGKIMLLRIKDKNKNAWQFRDSSFLMQESLSGLCESFKPKIRKIKMPSYPYDQHREKWVRYCMNDCKSLAQVLQIFSDKMVKDLGGCVGLTTSSTAMRTFRYKYLKQDIPTYFTWNNFIRDGYNGGRTEVFNMYAPLGEHYYYDVNSMYVSVMHDNIFPVSSPKRVHYRDPWDCIGKCGFMECDVITPKDLHIPLLPYRDANKHNKLIFPLGEWRATYEFSMIEKALKLGYEITPLRTIEFEGDYLFTEYASDTYNIKKNSPKKSAMYKISKLLGNGLYGKFGEHSEREEMITDDDADIFGTFPIPNDPMGYTTHTVTKYCAHHLPAIASRVTALSQLKLYEGIEMVNKRGKIVYYCDTDSMITDLKMKDSKELGQWGFEGKITRAVFFAPKAYCYEYIKEDGSIGLVQKLKSFSHDFSRTTAFEDFRQALPPVNDFSAFSEHRVNPCSFKEISTRNLGTFSTLVKTKKVKKAYDKRQFFDDYTTKPLMIMDNFNKSSRRHYPTCEQR